MSYMNRATGTARRLVKYFSTRSATSSMALTLTQRSTGGINAATLKPTTETTTAYTGQGYIITDDTMLSRLGIDRVGPLVVGVLRNSALWSPSVPDPQENDEVTVDGETGTVLKVHAFSIRWILECSQ